MGHSAHSARAGSSELSSADLRGALELVHDISSVADPDEFAVTATQGLFELIRCDLSTYSEISPLQGRAVPMTFPTGAQRADTHEAFSRNIGEHPQVRYYAAGNTSTTTMSDFFSARQFHRTRLYDELFRPVAGEYVLTTVLPLPPPIVAGWGLLRSSRDFSVRDRTLLDLLQPHLANAYRQSLMRAALGAMDGAAEQGAMPLVVLAIDGSVLYMTEPALTALRAHFGPDTRDDVLPRPVCDWLARDPSRPLSVACDGHSLRVDALGARPSALLLTERPQAPSAEALRELGLGRREAEVLALVAEGRTNAEIARALYVSAGTVKRHLESIYAKLGVHTRTAAAALAFKSSTE